MVISRIGMCVELRDRVCRVSELSILDGSFRKKSVSFPSWSPLVRLSQLESSRQTFPAGVLLSDFHVLYH